MRVGSAAARERRDAAVHVNEVRLVGRLSGEPEAREMPSGDLMLSFRLVVERGPTRRTSAPRSPTIDTLDCAAWRKDVQRALRAARPGDVLEVRGALRRRFWRAPGGPSSRSEVEVTSVRRCPRPAT
jgi:single-strand DNA-binding protein